MRTTLTILALIGLIGCRVTNNYYSIYPIKVERIDTISQPSSHDWGFVPNQSIDPGFYKPINTWGIITLGEGISIDTLDRSIIPEEWNLITKDTIK